jgi:hypothetical protein
MGGQMKKAETRPSFDDTGTGGLGDGALQGRVRTTPIKKLKKRPFSSRKITLLFF